MTNSLPCRRFSRPRASSNGRGKRRFFHGLPLLRHATDIIIRKGSMASRAPVRAVRPSSVLPPSQAADRTPPVTRARVDKNKIQIEASDEDGGSGVLKTLYSTDGVHIGDYTGDAIVLPRDARVLIARSVDRAGNIEYPGLALPVLGVDGGPVQLTVQAARRGQGSASLAVVNRDPTGLSGPLSWQATTDATWLTLIHNDQRGRMVAGEVPGKLGLLAEVEATQTDPLRTTVRVRANRDDALFSEQMIDVEVRFRK
jgi:hypothetical protein